MLGLAKVKLRKRKRKREEPKKKDTFSYKNIKKKLHFLIESWLLI